MRAASFFVLILGCAMPVAPAGPDPLAGCADLLPEGAALAPGHSIVACGVAPEVALFAVEDGVAYTAAPQGVFFAHDLETETFTRLYRSQWGAVYSPEWSAVWNGEIWFSGRGQMPDGSRTWAVMSVPIDRVTEDDRARIVVVDPSQNALAPFMHDGRRLYVPVQEIAGEGARQGPVMAIDEGEGALVRATPEWGDLVGIVGGDTMYYCTGDGLRRMPIDGGAPELMTDVHFEGGCVNVRAFDEDFAYGAPSDTPYEIWRYAPGVAERIYVAEVHAEVPQGPPTAMRRDDEWLYFLRGEQLSRVHADGSGDAQFVASGPHLSAPLFDDGHVYLAVDRGGAETPIERVILRIEKASLDPY